MKSVPQGPGSSEIELKLTLPGVDPATLLRRLARTPVLARRKSETLRLHNVYFDTPELTLLRQRVALRLRRVGYGAGQQWLQTLKTAGRSDSALSQRGEWETPVPEGRLSHRALEATPWSEIDTQGRVFRALAPVFTTDFERTLWLVRRRDGSLIEVALDIGQIIAGTRSTPICELELELKAGQPTALFDVARQITDAVAVLPATRSKAERGYALVQDARDAALCAQPQPLLSGLPMAQIVRRVTSEMFSQFTSNLNTLLCCDDPEVVHQARVGWRRFTSAIRLFRPLLAPGAMPSWQPLQTLLVCLGRLRDLDVARTETLPPLADAYVAADARRAELWGKMTLALLDASMLQRKAVRYGLADPGVGACLLATTQWLEGNMLAVAIENAKPEPGSSPRQWTRRRILRLHERLKMARKQADSPERKHRVRILAKRMRYNLEALQSLLPRKRTQRWRAQASHLQTHFGATRDAMQAATLVADLELDRGLAEFLRGLALGRN